MMVFFFMTLILKGFQYKISYQCARWNFKFLPKNFKVGRAGHRYWNRQMSNPSSLLLGFLCCYFFRLGPLPELRAKKTMHAFAHAPIWIPGDEARLQMPGLLSPESSVQQEVINYSTHLAQPCPRTLRATQCQVHQKNLKGQVEAQSLDDVHTEQYGCLSFQKSPFPVSSGTLET